LEENLPSVLIRSDKAIHPCLLNRSDQRGSAYRLDSDRVDLAIHPYIHMRKVQDEVILQLSSYDQVATASQRQWTVNRNREYKEGKPRY